VGSLTEYKRKRDFTKTAEPAGKPHGRTPHKKLRFVIQKHAASHLHYDFRLELDGVMKSWAVPKGPSVNTSVKRLAMEVEDHPIEYNTFEGTNPQGEYGGGTLMLWDRGTYTADEAEPGEDPEKVLKREYHAGKMSITLDGERLQGSWALVRTDPGPKPKWLLIKHRDAHARSYEATEEFVTSVVTDRTMEEIAGGRRVWHSNRGPGSGRASKKPTKKTSKKATRKATAKGSSRSAKSATVILPTRMQSARALPDDDSRVFLPWAGGERILAYATSDACALIDGNGADRSSDFGDAAESLSGLARRMKQSFVLDGELTGDGDLRVMDILFIGDHALIGEPFSDRRQELESLFRRRRVANVAVAPMFESAPQAVRLAEKEGLSGVVAIDPSSAYTPGKRTRDWIAVSV
jgi:bifunctional non-homologous end joining protein LigD